MPMIYVFLTTTIFFICFLFAEITMIQHLKNKVRKSIQVMLSLSAAACLFQLLGLFATDEFMAKIFYGLYFVVGNIHILSILICVECYDKVFKFRTPVRLLLDGMFVIDLLFMVGNAYGGYAFELEKVQVVDNLSFCYPIMNFPTAFVHFIIYYALILTLISALFMKTIHTYKLYREKYMVMCIAVIIAFLTGFIVSFSSLRVDISSLLFALLSFSTSFLLLYWVPRRERKSIIDYSLDRMPDAVMCFNKDNSFLYANVKARELFHLDDVIEKAEDNLINWFGDKSPRDIPEQSFNEQKTINGETIHYNTKFQPLFDESGNYAGCVFTMHNRTEDENALVAEREKADMDSLTGILNREGFFGKVRQKIDSDPDTKWLLVCADIKDFKTYNALFGERLGDEVLITAANVFSEYKGENCIVGRLGSDRFALCIPMDDYKEEILLQNLRKICASVKSDVFRLHMHAGLYPIHDYNMQISVMCDHAFLAVRKIKDDYGEMLAWYDSAMGADHRNHKIMIGEFDKALEEGQFQMFLQPQLSVDEKIIGAEALVRWMHPVKGLIPPMEFIPVFERAGLIHKLDQFIWQQACKKLAAWETQGREDLYISVNISPLDFYYVDIYEYITKLVEEYKINPKKLKLEITETAIVNEATDNLVIIQKLRNAGFEVEIDDFGSGFSSLNTLKDIDVDAIKLDRIFLKETSHKEKSRVIMNNTIAMSKQLGIKIVSEGVETKEQVEYLVDAGTDVFQGYYYDRPMSVSSFEEKYLGM